MSKLLVIENTKIKQDSQGRYCLNDLHRASGGNPTQAPAQFFRNKSVSDFVQTLTDMQICTSPVNTIRGGIDQGTYVCRELVFKYAAWIKYQTSHSRDLFTVKTGTAEHGHNYTQTRVTSKGIEYIASRYASELML